MARVVNLRFMCCGLKFDAAIDCDWTLHCYSNSNEEKETTTPIELYCLDRKDWDIRMIFQENARNMQLRNDIPNWAMYNTAVDWDFVIKEAEKWVQEHLSNEY